MARRNGGHTGQVRATRRASRVTKAGAKQGAGDDIFADLLDLPARALDAVSQVSVATAELIEKPLGLGITFAKIAEHSLLDVSEIRGTSPDALLPRVRADVHELIDLLTDAVTLASRSLPALTGGIVNVTSGRARVPQPAPLAPPPQPFAWRSSASQSSVPSEGAASDTLVFVDVPGPLAPGMAGERPIVIDNETDTPAADLHFSSSDLVAPSGASISNDQVSFDPPSLFVPAKGSGQVVVRISIPAGVPAGSYEGSLQGIRVQGQKTILHVDVA